MRTAVRDIAARVALAAALLGLGVGVVSAQPGVLTRECAALYPWNMLEVPAIFCDETAGQSQITNQPQCMSAIGAELLPDADQPVHPLSWADRSGVENNRLARAGALRCEVQFCCARDHFYVAGWDTGCFQGTLYK